MSSISKVGKPLYPNRVQGASGCGFGSSVGFTASPLVSWAVCSVLWECTVRLPVGVEIRADDPCTGSNCSTDGFLESQRVYNVESLKGSRL